MHHLWSHPVNTVDMKSVVSDDLHVRVLERSDSQWPEEQ
jgi:hypothetical protein